MRAALAVMMLLCGFTIIGSIALLLSLPYEPSMEHYEPYDTFTPGLGLSFSGQMGTQIAPGWVLTPKGLSPGFGF